MGANIGLSAQMWTTEESQFGKLNRITTNPYIYFNKINFDERSKEYKTFQHVIM